MKKQSATLLSSLGAGLEYYDFIIYGMMAEHLSQVFFVSQTSWLGLLKTFFIFAVGYLGRPLGGIFFGALGDAFGRKKSFLSVMSLMALATLGIGLLPSYEQAGSLAPCLLLFLRLMQGISMGAELPGAITLVYEFNDHKKQAFSTGIVVASTCIGAILASLMLFILNGSLTKTQILHGGWRIPFLFGGCLAFVNYLIRCQLQETPQFLQSKKDSSLATHPRDIIFSLCLEWKKIMQGTGMTFIVSSLVISALYFPTFLTLHFGYSAQEIHLATLISMLWCAVILPLCGRLADRLDKYLLFSVSAGAFILLVFPLFALLKWQTWPALVLFILIYQTFIALISGCYYPILAALFPTSIRYTGVAACYNISYSLIATLPLIYTALINLTNNPDCLVWILIFLALLSAVCCPPSKLKILAKH